MFHLKLYWVLEHTARELLDWLIDWLIDWFGDWLIVESAIESATPASARSPQPHQTMLRQTKRTQRRRTPLSPETDGSLRYWLIDLLLEWRLLALSWLAFHSVSAHYLHFNSAINDSCWVSVYTDRAAVGFGQWIIVGYWYWAILL